MAADSIPAGLAAACAAVRPATPDDHVSGVRPAFVAAPASTEEASAVLRAAAELGLAVVPRGTGCRLHWGAAPERCDLIVSTELMNQVIGHAAGDLVVTAQAGLPLERLAQVLALAGQRLALDPPALPLPPQPGGPVGCRPAPADQPSGDGHAPSVSRGTVGGVIAAGAAGPLRLRYGSPRDLLIGITVVRADGTVARSGGKVVKNVAGYDLGKLFAGSRGTLGLITEATFRLHPVPAATRYVMTELPGPAGLGALVGGALDAALVPVAAEIDWPQAGAGLRLAFALEGEPAAVGDRAADLAARLGPHQTMVTGEPPPWWGEGAAAQAGTVLQIACWPAEVSTVLAELRAAAARAGLDPAVSGSAGAGVLHAAVPPDADPAVVAGFVAALRSSFGRLGGAGSDRVDRDGRPARATAVVLHAPPAVCARVDLFGPVPSLALMRAVKARFDPDRAMAPGRFAGGI